jgi:3-deoxy-manno-octulosonate cytidylyltransferase (CMP-KDO synthetase)
MRIALMIPARLESQRLANKLLLQLGEKPLLQHTWERGREALDLALKGGEWAGLWIATDSEEIAGQARDWGAQVLMTSSMPRNGTERIAEAVDQIQIPVDAVLNLQGDEPFADPQVIVALAQRLIQGPELMCTLACPLDPEDLEVESVVKVVCDTRGRALYFSRAGIPHLRSKSSLLNVPRWRHLGLYAYTLDLLREWMHLEPTPLELAESLEQLRVLEYGFAIGILFCQQGAHSVDTLADFEKALRIYQERKVGGI